MVNMNQTPSAAHDILRAMNQVNFFPDDVVIDGNIHRFRRSSHEKKKNCWYVAREFTTKRGSSLHVATWADWSEGNALHRFKSPYQSLYADEQKEIERAAISQTELKSLEWDRVSEEATEKWESLSMVTLEASLYLIKKGLGEQTYGCRIAADPLTRAIILYVPLRDVEGRIWSLQTIQWDGEKRFLPGGKVKGHFHQIGDILSETPILIAEGLATAASLHLALNWPVIVAFDAGNLLEVGPKIRQKYPTHRIIICGDDDAFNGHANVGKDKATKCADFIDAIAVFPRFKDVTSRPTDFNDLHQLEGLEAVRNQIFEAPVVHKVAKNPGKRPKATCQDYFDFFDKHLGGSKKDIMSGDFMTMMEGLWQPVANRLLVLESHAIDTGLLSHNHLQKYLARYIETKPPELLIEIPAWDRIDRVKNISECITLKNCSREDFENLLKDWGSKVFKRLVEPSIQNRILVLKGEQGLGKDTLVESLVGGLDLMTANLTMSRNEVDNLAMLVDHLVLNISEFDRTCRTDASTLKDWITRSEATFRRPYARSAKRYAVRTSFISTVNVDEILRDHTGNRRFLIFDIDSIEFKYPTKESAQILAQFKWLADTDFKPSDESEKKMRQYIEGQTPEDPKEIILEDFDIRIGNMAYGNPSKKGEFTFEDIKEVLSDMSKIHQMRMQTLLTILNRNGRSRKTMVSRVYFKGIS